MSTSRVVQHSARRRATTVLAPLVSLALVLAACGGDDSAAPATTVAAAEAESGNSGATADGGVGAELELGDVTDLGELGSALGADEIIGELSIENRMIALVAGLESTGAGVTYEVINETSAFVYLDQGSVADSFLGCTVAGFISEGLNVILVYPDGETDCSD